MRTTLLATAALILSLVPAMGCGGPDGVTPAEEGFVEASAQTKEELGVSRWGTKDAPASIDGYDDSDQIVVTLKHAVSEDGDYTVHSFGVADHGRTAVRQVAMPNGTSGAFKILKDTVGQQLDPNRVLERMAADLGEQATVDHLTSKATSAASTLSPMGGPGDRGGLVKLDCGGPQLVRVSILVAQACLGDAAQTDCPDQLKGCKYKGI